MQQLRLNMVDCSMSFPLLSTWNFWWTSRGNYSEALLFFEFCGTPHSCLKVVGWSFRTNATSNTQGPHFFTRKTKTIHLHRCLHTWPRSIYLTFTRYKKAHTGMKIIVQMEASWEAVLFGSEDELCSRLNKNDLIRIKQTCDYVSPLVTPTVWVWAVLTRTLHFAVLV